GIALTKGTSQFTADYILDPANSSGSTNNNIIIQNPEVISYLAISPYLQVAYVEVSGSSLINMRSEVVRVDSFNSSKIYFNNGANKYVYKLNYRVNNASEVKFLIDGIALEPYTDYNINVQNPYEIFLPNGIKFGTVISAYYLVGGASNSCTISNVLPSSPRYCINGLPLISKVVPFETLTPLLYQCFCLVNMLFLINKPPLLNIIVDANNWSINLWKNALYLLRNGYRFWNV
ncbi:unnamed protein product, partial [marine sediment metagenome]